MNADSKETVKRTSPVRVSPLISLEEYKGGMDFGTNYMSVKSGATQIYLKLKFTQGFMQEPYSLNLTESG